MGGIGRDVELALGEGGKCVSACALVSVCMSVSSFMFISVRVSEFICQSLSVCVCVTCVHHFAFV